MDFEDLPEEMLCEIISRITRIQEIINYSETSPRFYQLARKCVTRLDSDEYTEVPLTWLSEFRNLRVAGDNIRILVTPQTLHLVKSLPRLLEANFVLKDLSFRNLIEQLDLKSIFSPMGRKDLNRKSYRIIDENGLGVIIQGDRGITFGVGGPSPPEGYPQLHFINRFEMMRLVYPDYQPEMYFQSMFLINPKLRDYLLRTDFGLVDPSQPPSEANPPLSLYLRRIVEGGLIDVRLMIELMKIYFLYRRQVEGKAYLLDPEFVNYWVGYRLGRVTEPSFRRMVINMTMHQPNWRSLSEYDVPLWSVDEPKSSGKARLVTPGEYRGIFDLLQRNVQFYQQGGPFYTTQGTVR